MATPGTPPPGAGPGGPPAGGGAGAAPPPPPGPEAGGGPGGVQAPASQESIMLAKLYQACKQLAQANPAMAPGLSKAADGIQEAQTALVTQPQNTQQPPPEQTPPY